MENNRIRFVDYKGKRILLEDFSNVKSEDELEKLIWQAETVVHSQLPKSLLVVVDMTSSTFGPKVSQTSKEASKSNSPYIKASAMVGMSKLMEIILNSVRTVSGRSIASFGTREEAYEWLIKQ